MLSELCQNLSVVPVSKDRFPIARFTIAENTGNTLNNLPRSVQRGYAPRSPHFSQSHSIFPRPGHERPKNQLITRRLRRAIRIDPQDRESSRNVNPIARSQPFVLRVAAKISTHTRPTPAPPLPLATELNQRVPNLTKLARGKR